MNVELLVFEVAGQQFGIRAPEVREVLRAVTISPLPGAPPVFEGVINLRGRVVAVLNLRVLLGVPSKALEHTDHLIVVQADQRVLAIRVDRALHLAQFSDAQIESSDAVAHTVPFVSEIARTSDGMVHVLAPSKLLSAAQSAALRESFGRSAATEVAV
jgi:purine-binding chemotaxis protein CheW